MPGFSTQPNDRTKLLVLALAALAATAPAAAQNAFTEEAFLRGVNYVQSTSVGWMGHGVGFADLDGDMDPDLVLIGAADGHVGIYENTGGSFLDRSAGSQIPPLPEASGVAAADFDGDGRIDLFLTQGCDIHGSTCSTVGDLLMRNIGGFVFEDVTRDAFPGIRAVHSEGAAVGDYDGDGWLDLYVAVYPDPDGTVDPVYNRMFRNQGDGTFADVTASTGLADGSEGLTFDAGLFDYDLDGDLDLYMGNDKGWFSTPEYYQGNRLWRNEGDGTFTDVTFSSGTDARIGFMGLAVGDMNNDGWPDMYMSNMTGTQANPYGNPLYINNGDGTFTQSNVEAGVVSERWGWGVLCFDFDNNGYEDLYVPNTPTANTTAHNRLYANPGSFPFTDVAPLVGVDDDGLNLTAAAADIDNDGDQDLVVGALDAPVRLFVNHEGSNRNWLKLKLFDGGGNVDAIGARVELRVGAMQIQRHLQAGIGFKSAQPLMLHVGIGDATMIDELTVHWPGGESKIMRDVPANRIAVVADEGIPCSTARLGIRRSAAQGDGPVDLWVDPDSAGRVCLDRGTR